MLPNKSVRVCVCVCVQEIPVDLWIGLIQHRLSRIDCFRQVMWKNNLIVHDHIM